MATKQIRPEWVPGAYNEVGKDVAAPAKPVPAPGENRLHHKELLKPVNSKKRYK